MQLDRWPVRVRATLACINKSRTSARSHDTARRNWLQVAAHSRTEDGSVDGVISPSSRHFLHEYATTSLTPRASSHAERRPRTQSSSKQSKAL
eukprot:4068602-Pleurochrysis_carterae.AAC.1